MCIDDENSLEEDNAMKVNELFVEILLNGGDTHLALVPLAKTIQKVQNAHWLVHLPVT